MATRFVVQHQTRYAYAGPARAIRTTVRMKPIDWPGQRLIDHRLVFEPAGEVRGAVPGVLANLDWVEVEGPTEAFAVLSRAIVDVDRAVPELAPDDPPLRDLVPSAADAVAPDPRAMLGPSARVPHEPAIARWAAPILGPDRPVLDAVFALAGRLNREMRYQPGATRVDTPVGEAFAQAAGVCQDFAHVMLAALRAHGVPAAYVSGYVRTYPAPGTPRLLGADASHAWVLFWAGPARGWVGIDPTNAIWMAGDHIVTAIGRDYDDVAPVEGVFVGPPGGSMTVSVDVAPIAPLDRGS